MHWSLCFDLSRSVHSFVHVDLSLIYLSTSAHWEFMFWFVQVGAFEVMFLFVHVSAVHVNLDFIYLTRLVFFFVQVGAFGLI